MAQRSSLAQLAVALSGRPLTGEQDPFVQRFLQAVRAAGGTQVNVISGYRSPAHNQQVGGATDSNHTRGLALDATVFIPGKGFIPAGDLPTLERYGLRSGDQPGFFHGQPDPNHVDAGYRAQTVAPVPAATPTPAPAPQASSLAAAVSRELTKFPSLDPQAVLAVARQEGLGGGVGDNGTSFGPFQLHYGGAYPTTAPHGSPAASQQYATSPAGIDYALSGIQKVAGGLKGPKAVNAIVTGFERPANPQREIQGALASYGHVNAPAPAPAGGASLATAAARRGPATTAPARRQTSPLLKLALQLLRS